MPRLLPLAAAAALATLSLGVAAPASATATTYKDLNVRATASHHLHMVTHLSAGVVRFRIHGPAEEDLQLARPKGGAGAKELVADGNAVNSRGSAAGIERDFVALGGASTGHSFWVRLEPGTYYAIDTNAEKATTSQVVTLHVTGDGGRGALPHADGTVTAVHDMDWAGSPKRIPASGVLRFDNASSEYHFVVLVRLKKASTTVAQIATALQKQDDGLFDQRGSYDTGVLSPGLVQASTYHLPKGTYAVLCFWPDEHGVPHSLMGMIRKIRVG